MKTAPSKHAVTSAVIAWERSLPSGNFSGVTVPIFPHASLDSLMEGLSGEWSARREGPLPVPVVVPSLPFSDCLQLRIARERGVCMGFDFLMPQDFISRALGQREILWSRRHLCWRILPHVGTCAAELGVENPSPRDRFAIAGLLADRFDQYGHFRPEIIRRWAAGKSALKSTASSREKTAETWQRKLWRTVNDEISLPHPVLELERQKVDKASRDKLRKAFPKLLVLGTGSVDPLLVEVIGLLAEVGGDVRIHVVLPSLGYLGDLKKRGALPPEDNDPESIEVAGGHPLLESMGRHAIGSFLLLGKLDEQYTRWPEPDASEKSGGSLLSRLQSDIRSVREPAALEPEENDISLRVHSCFGPRREMEVLRDEVLRAFRDIPDLKPEEVHIVTPSLETYAPLVAAVFEQGGIPVRLTGLPRSGRDPVIGGVLALLEMALGGRFEASWIMELLRMRPVQEALGIADDEKSLERVCDGIRQSGLTQGLGGEEPGTWGFSRDRLIAGRWFGPGDPAKYPDGKFLLPVAGQLGGDSELFGRFIAWHSRLEATFLEWRRDATPARWGERLRGACEELLSGNEEARLAILPHLAFLQALECPEQTDAGAILDWLDAESGESGLRGNVSGRITFGGFKQLQNIPCRVLAMVGMQEGPFPGQSRVPAWDLLKSDPLVWDRNPRVDDRQLFLDAILTPRDRLVITAANRNVRSGKDEPFSSCVDELLRVAGEMGAPQSGLIVRHRLQPFAPEYFDGSQTLPPSFDPQHAEAAKILVAGNRLPGIPFSTGREDGAVEKTGQPLRDISPRQLVDFWKEPAKAFFKALGIAIPQGEEDEEILDRAPLSLNGLQAWKIKNAIVEEMVGAATTPEPAGSAQTAGRDTPGLMEHAGAQLRADRGLPPGSLGDRCWQAGRELGEPLGEGVKKHLGGEMAVDLELAGVRITGSLLTADGGKDLLVYRAGKFQDARHYLEPWIHAVIAAAAGRAMPLRLLDESGPDEGRKFPAIDRRVATTALANLVRGFLAGQQSPLAYGALTSDVYAKCLAKTGDQDIALAAAAEAWAKEAWRDLPAGEGLSPAARIAWRDTDPFDEPGPWIEWAENIAVPLRDWINETP